MIPTERQDPDHRTKDANPSDLSPSALAAIDAKMEEAIAQKDDFLVAQLTSQRGVFIEALTGRAGPPSWSQEEIQAAVLRHEVLLRSMEELRDQRSRDLGDCSRNAHAIQAYTGSVKATYSKGD